jgi:hypothetical protein
MAFSPSRIWRQRKVGERVAIIAFMLLVTARVGIAQVSGGGTSLPGGPAPEGSAWKVPSCSSLPKAKRFGFRMQLPVPKGARVQFTRDVDYSEFWIRIRLQGRRLYLKSMAGPFVARAVAFEDLRKESVYYNERALESEDGSIHWLDTRGTLHDGTKWRWAGPIIGDMVSYEGAPEEASKFFDGIIDAMCITD